MCDDGWIVSHEFRPKLHRQPTNECLKRDHMRVGRAAQEQLPSDSNSMCNEAAAAAGAKSAGASPGTATTATAAAVHTWICSSGHG
jgi:hypothetical protein